MKLLTTLFLCFILATANAQDSCKLTISLLTCAPGEELYSIFGHTALRVKNQQSGSDEVYNYGSFEFGPDFYIQFIRGKLLYFLSVENFPDFTQNYQSESRSIQEQVLHFDCAAKEKLYQALQHNSMEQNKYYKYDFLYDNCTTRAGEMATKYAGGQVFFKNILPKDIPSFRDLIHNYLHAGQQYWSKLGIDILLGAKLDKKVTNKEAMFLPDNLLKGFDSATYNNQSLVFPPKTILHMPAVQKPMSFFTPLVVFSFLLVTIILLSYFKNKWTKTFLDIFDFLLFFVLGLAGFLLLFMWLGTDHKLCQNNYNLLWALPTNVLPAFFISSKKMWINKYYNFVFWITLALLVTWYFLPQEMNNGLLPVVFLILFRSYNLSKKEINVSEKNKP